MLTPIACDFLRKYLCDDLPRTRLYPWRKYSSFCNSVSHEILRTLQAYRGSVSSHVQLQKYYFFVFFGMSLHNIGLRIHGGPEREATNSWPSFCQSLNRFSFFLFRWKISWLLSWLLKITPHLAYVATLPCETLMSENKRLTINYNAL